MYTDGWNKCFSLAEKEVPIKASAQAVLTYSIACFSSALGPLLLAYKQFDNQVLVEQQGRQVQAVLRFLARDNPTEVNERLGDLRFRHI